MKNLKTFYKEEIKKLALNLKQAKPKTRKLQSLYSKGLSDSEEGKALAKFLYPLPSIFQMKHEVRYLYLAYAIVRGKDISKVESNPKNPHDAKTLAYTLEKMEKIFKEKEVANV